MFKIFVNVTSLFSEHNDIKKSEHELNIDFTIINKGPSNGKWTLNPIPQNELLRFFPAVLL